MRNLFALLSVYSSGVMKRSHLNKVLSCFSFRFQKAGVAPYRESNYFSFDAGTVTWTDTESVRCKGESGNPSRNYGVLPRS